MVDVQSLSDYSGDRAGGGEQWTNKSASRRDTWEQVTLRDQPREETRGRGRSSSSR